MSLFSVLSTSIFFVSLETTAYHYKSYIHDSFINPNGTLNDPKNDITHLDVPWTGVRPSKLAYALEPRNADSLSFSNVNTVDYLPLCNWGVDHTSRDDKKDLTLTQGCKLSTVSWFSSIRFTRCSYSLILTSYQIPPLLRWDCWWIRPQAFLILVYLVARVAMKAIALQILPLAWYNFAQKQISAQAIRESSSRLLPIVQLTALLTRANSGGMGLCCFDVIFMTQALVNRHGDWRLMIHAHHGQILVCLIALRAGKFCLFWVMYNYDNLPLIINLFLTLYSK